MPGNARRGRPQGQCHREETAGSGERSRRPARVKRGGKSAPRPRRRGRHGKPHREQGQIGAARGWPAMATQASFPSRRPGRPREAPGNRRPRGMAIPASGQDRTRLTGRLAFRSQKARSQNPRAIFLAFWPSGFCLLGGTYKEQGAATISCHRYLRHWAALLYSCFVLPSPPM